MTEQKILNQLEEISKKLNLDFNKEWFKVVWVTKEQGLLTDFLSDCPDPDFHEYGKNMQERGSNIYKFYNSNKYNKKKSKYGGKVEYSKKIPYIREYANQLENDSLKNKLLDYCEKLECKSDGVEKIAVLTETENEKEKEQLLKVVLSHEWVHVLLEKNNIRPNDWKYNEGLVTYLDHYSRNELDFLDVANSATKDPHTKIYYENAILFRDLLKNTKDENKIEKIKEFLSKN